MPIYEYKCEDCEHQMEAIQKFRDDPLKVCPACGKQSLKKLVSAAAFHLKGTGWYETDFKGKPKPKDEAKKDESPTKNDANKSDDKKSKGDSVKPSKKESTSTKAD